MGAETEQAADPAHVDAVLARARTSVPACGPVTVVALDGRSGSGKTTLGSAVADAWGAPLLHMDEIYPGWDGLAASVGVLEEQVLAPLARGERPEYRRWDWTHDRWGPLRRLPAEDRLVVEGCGVAVRPAGDRAAVRVWLEAPRALRQRRGLSRDGEAYRPHWQRWAAQEDALFAADGTRERAHLVLRTGADAPGGTQPEQG